MIEGKSLEELRQLIDAANSLIAKREGAMREAVRAYCECYGYDDADRECGEYSRGLRAAYPHLKRAMGDA